MLRGIWSGEPVRTRTERSQMKRIYQMVLAWILAVTLCFPITAYAVGEGNIDNGGGGMGLGTSQNCWTPGMEGVRVTVVEAEGGRPVTTPIDLTDLPLSNIAYSFGKVCKISYLGGQGISPDTGVYQYVNPGQPLPRIISSQTLGPASIEAIKSYFTDEQVVRSIAGLTDMDFDTLIGGEYKLFLEPVMYVLFQGVMIAMTATEAACYDEVTGGAVRRVLPTVAFQNLPLSMFLERGDLGFPAWSGPRSGVRSNWEVKSSLGLGIVRFNEETTPPEVSTYDYEYRVNTEVITSVSVRGGQADPDHPVSVTFRVGGRSMRVNNVYYPSGDSQLVWIRWTTPATPQVMTITVSASGRGHAEQSVITANIVDLDQDPPPDPQADDRNDGFMASPLPVKAQQTSLSWNVWRPWWQEHWVWHSGGRHSSGYWCDHGWWEFDLDVYEASLSADMRITPDGKNPTAFGRTLKSGYGIQELVTATVHTSQSPATTPAQNAVTYFPEFQYDRFWRLLERTRNGYHAQFEFQENEYSTYGRRTHFSPIWYPDGRYAPYTWLLDCWTPAGMLSMNLSDSVTIQGDLWMDWHIAPQEPS